MTDADKLHVVVFQWLASDHLVPFFELSKLIAGKGHKISFISTPRIIKRLPKLQSNLVPLLNFVTFSSPKVDGLPETSDAIVNLSSNASHWLMKAIDSLETELTHFLEKSIPDWVIYDNFAPIWLPPIAAKLGISRAFFSVNNACCLASMVSLGIKDFDGQKSIVPQFPFKLADHIYQEKGEFSDIDRFRQGIMGCEVIVTRDCLEFESDWLNLAHEIYKKPVLQLGLMPPSLQENGDDKTFTWLAVSDWLDKQEKGSVIYVSLGSNTTISQKSLTELALGLELSDLPFFWSFKKLPRPNDHDSVKLPSGFEQRTKGRGIVCRSWAPQLRILAHDSVGSFLTQCSWSSIIEGLMFGRPLIMLPFNIEQGLNSKIMVKNNVGVEILRDENDGSFTRESVAESLKLVMAHEDGKCFRDKAKEKSIIFADKVRHDQYADSFVEYLQNHRRMTNMQILLLSTFKIIDEHNSTFGRL